MVKLLVIILPAFFIAISSAYAAPHITLSVDDVHSPFLSIKGIQASLGGPRASLLEIKLGEVAVQGKIWRSLRFSCHTFQFSEELISCDDGVLRLFKSAPVPATFHYSSRDKTLDVKIQMTSDEASEGWQFSARWGGAAWEGVLTVTNGQVARIAELLPDKEREMLAPAKGKINGTARLSSNAGGLANIEANLAVDGLAFSDVSGLHAGENISGEIIAKAELRDSQPGNLWEWQADVSWPKGEIFWQPLYFTGQGHRLRVNGNLDDSIIRLLKGNLVLAGIGEADLSGVADRATNTLRDLDLHAGNLELSALFSQVLKPFLADTSFTGLKAAGHAGIQLRYRNGAAELLNLNLRDVSVEDEHERFAFRGVNAKSALCH